MIRVRPAGERGHFDHGWLDTNHTFSFGAYRDPQQMGFRSLRVMNEDWIAPGQGFGTHGHRDMEIVTYVLEGALEHRDSMGNGEILRPGEFQRMSAGTGITHSEFNPSATEPAHLYQIWLLPERPGITPSYEQKAFAPEEMRGRWRVVAARNQRDGALLVQQDARILLTQLAAGESVDYALEAGRHAWVQVLRGEVQLNGLALAAGDGAAVSDEATLRVAAASSAAEVMLFDLA